MTWFFPIVRRSSEGIKPWFYRFPLCPVIGKSFITKLLRKNIVDIDLKGESAVCTTTIAIPPPPPWPPKRTRWGNVWIELGGEGVKYLGIWVGLAVRGHDDKLGENGYTSKVNKVCCYCLFGAVGVPVWTVRRLFFKSQKVKKKETHLQRKLIFNCEKLKASFTGWIQSERIF